MKRASNLIRTDSLTGNRVPLAFQTLEQQLYETARRSPLVRPADEGLPDLLHFFTGILDSRSLESLVDSCAGYLGIDWDKTTSGTLLASLYRNLLHEDDTEGYVVTTGFFVRMIEPEIARLDGRGFVLEVVRRYLKSVSYLYPLLSGFSYLTLKLANSLDQRPLYLFLRDALVFWPALYSLREKMGDAQMNFMIYTRSLSKSGMPPLIHEEADRGKFRLARTSRIRGMLVDVGLYGTLVMKLERDGYIGSGSSAYFLGSRNPNIAGFLNQILQQPDATTPHLADPLEIVKAIDTIECLLKPFLINSLRINQRFTVLLGLCDFISFVCFCAFSRELFAFTQKRQLDDAGIRKDLDFAEPGEGSWYLNNPIPAWTGAPGFLKRWNAPNLVGSERIDHLFHEILNIRSYEFA